MRRTSLLVVAIAGLGGTAAMFSGPPLQAVAAIAPSYRALAAANGVTTVIGGSAVPAGAEAEADGPSAQCAIDSSGASTGLASLLYPGSYILAVPGLLHSQGAPEAPPYPLVVQSDAADPSASSSGSGYSLAAQSADRSSQASGSVGGSTAQGSIGSASATAQVDATSIQGKVVATAASLTESIDAGPLRIGRVSSTAQAVYDSVTGQLTRSSSLTMGDSTVNGIQVGLTDHGLVVAGQTIAVPGNPLADTLASAGITVTYLAAHPLSDGVLSPGVEIAVSPPGQGYTTTFTVGHSLAVAASGPAPPASPAIVFPTSTAPFATSAPSVVVAPPPTTASVPTAAPAVPSAVPRPAAPRAAPRRAPPDPIPAYFYLVLVAAALTSLAVGQLVQRRGVRWASFS